MDVSQISFTLPLCALLATCVLLCSRSDLSCLLSCLALPQSYIPKPLRIEELQKALQTAHHAQHPDTPASADSSSQEPTPPAAVEIGAIEIELFSV
jgi:hypothetical protein